MAAVKWRVYGAIGLAIGRRPALWPVAIAQLRRLAAPGWWRRPPFLPLPPRDYLRFRALTMYGSADRAPGAADVVSYLTWCKAAR